MSLRTFLWRVLGSLTTLWLVTTLVFFAIRLSHIDPLAALLGQGLASQAQVAEMRAALGLDRPLLQQYALFLSGLARGDLGRSLFDGQPVVRAIAQSLRFTAPLALTAWLLAIALGLTLGSLASRASAWETGRPARWLARLTGAMLILGTSTPVAWSGLLILWAAVPLLTGLRPGPARDVAQLALPALTLGIASGCSLGRVAQAGLSRARREPFFIAARARGIGPLWRLEWSALRTTLAPVISLAGVEAAFLLGGTMVTETLFARPGVGRLLVESILRGDFPLVQAIVALMAGGYALFNLLADVLASSLDPRLREEAE